VNGLGTVSDTNSGGNSRTDGTLPIPGARSRGGPRFSPGFSVYPGSPPPLLCAAKAWASPHVQAQVSLNSLKSDSRKLSVKRETGMPLAHRMVTSRGSRQRHSKPMLSSVMISRPCSRLRSWSSVSIEKGCRPVGSSLIFAISSSLAICLGSLASMTCLPSMT